MATNKQRREKFMAVFLPLIEKLAPGSKNRETYEKELAALSDAQFEEMVVDIESGMGFNAVQGGLILPVYMPNLNTTKISVKRNIALAKELGHDFFQRIWITDPHTNQRYLTPRRYMTLLWSVRRQAQTLEGKQSIPTDTTVIDDLTGQPTGESKGSALTYPELQVLHARGLQNTIIEALKVRGGDLKALNQFERDIIETGGSSLQPILAADTKVKSTQTLDSLLRGMHLKSNL